MKNGQKIWIDNTPKKTYRWQISHICHQQASYIVRALPIKNNEMLHTYGNGKNTKQPTTLNAGKNVEQQQLLSFLVGMQNGVVWWFLRKLDTHLPYKPAIVLFIYQSKMETYVHMKTCTQMFMAALFIKAKIRELSRCPAACECTRQPWFASWQWNIIQRQKETSSQVMKRHGGGLSAYPKWRTPTWEVCLLYGSSYMTLWERQNYGDNEKISGRQRLGAGEGNEETVPEDLHGSETVPCWYGDDGHVHHTRRCTTPRMKPNMNSGLWWRGCLRAARQLHHCSMRCSCWERRECGNAVLSAEFCCEPKAAWEDC